MRVCVALILWLASLAETRPVSTHAACILACVDRVDALCPVQPKKRRACQRRVWKRCQRKGLAIECPTTTSTTTTTSTSTTLPFSFAGVWQFNGTLSTNTCGLVVPSTAQAIVAVVVTGSSVQVQVGANPVETGSIVGDQLSAHGEGCTAACCYRRDFVANTSGAALLQLRSICAEPSDCTTAYTGFFSR